MNMLETFLAAIVANPCDNILWLVLADLLEENEDPRRADLLRLHRQLLGTCCDPEQHPGRAAWHAEIVALIAAGVQPCVPQRTLQLPGDVPMIFSFIPPGHFRMGSEHMSHGTNERPVHMVTLTNGFYCGIHSVTQSQWKSIMRTSPSHFHGSNLPVETVSWEEAQKFCAGLSRHLKLKKAEEVRLLTEAEWEYACRAGTTTEYHFGDNCGMNMLCCHPVGTPHHETMDVGSFPCNPWGLYDVHGNIWEWCKDYYVRYTSRDRTDPCRRRITSNAWRILRGGAYFNDPVLCRSATRFGLPQSTRSRYYGFRVCFTASESASLKFEPHSRKKRKKQKASR